jgi:soluble cytochrome b562
MSDDRYELLNAKFNHYSWKTFLSGYLQGDQKLTREEVVSPNHCKLGMWLDQGGRAKYAQYPEMKRLDELHLELHAKMAEIVEAKEAGKVKEAKAMLRSINGICDELIGQIDGILQKLSQ